jgi:hypothetical protein
MESPGDNALLGLASGKPVTRRAIVSRRSAQNIVVRYFRNPPWRFSRIR